MEENILDRIADLCISLGDFDWGDFQSGKPEYFDDLTVQEKMEVVSDVIWRLKYMLNHTADTLTSWSWQHKQLGRTFDEYLNFQLNYNIDKIPKSPYCKKSYKKSIWSRFKYSASKVNKQKDQKQV